LSQQKRKCIAVVRIRGRAHVPKHIADTLKMLNLTRNNHATLIIDNPSAIGMIQHVRDYVTWGEISEDTILSLLKKRAEIKGGEKLTEANVKEALGFASLKKLAEALYKAEVGLNKVQKLKPVFRLHPPRHGFKGDIARQFRSRGETGYRGEAIDKLIASMI